MLVAPSGNLSDINAQFGNVAKKTHASFSIAHEGDSFFIESNGRKRIVMSNYLQSRCIDLV